MKLQTLARVVAGHPFFAGLDDESVDFITGCAKNVRFAPGEALFHEGGRADWFYLIRRGRVSLDIEAPSRGTVTVQTIEAGEVLGWSWLFPPYRYAFGATALEPVEALAMDGACLRGKCDADPALGYELMKRFARVMAQRMHHARVQLMDVYGED